MSGPVSGPGPAGEAVGGEPRWYSRATGCPDNGGHGATSSSGLGALTTGAVGGEGLALLVHNDPLGLEAKGCAGVGVGYGFDSSYYRQCREHIANSMALQLSPHFNVTEARRHGRHVAADEAGFLTWAAMDQVGVYLNGDNHNALATRTFSAPGRRGSLLDGGRHVVNVVYARGMMRVKFNHESSPSLSLPIDLGTAGAYDADGNAWIGFTAASGITSIDTDLLSFAFCSSPGMCDAT